ncbi:MAG TPA: carboxymuconolactone decarboxylase family protein [Gammaproteobacteria bacterium]|nr:carboxymuconolactone decarboxylase family protein [Gammaproteobacteria bacterium]
MTKNFPVHTLETAPEAARPVMEAVQQAFGFIPNLIGIMSSSPALAEAYQVISGIFEKTGLTPAERQVVLLTVSRFHACRYCVAAHSAISAMQKVPDEVVRAIREDESIADPKLQALREFVRRLLEKRGWLNEEDVQEFLSAGYEPSHVLDVLVGVAQKTLSNFTNHIANTPLDDVFASRAWAPDAGADQATG